MLADEARAADQGSAKAAGGELMVDQARGKGGHYVIRFQGRFSVIKSGEITPVMRK